MLKFALCAFVLLLLACAVPGQKSEPVPAPKAQMPAGTWILQIEGDARGLNVTGISHKDFRFRAPRGLSSPYRVGAYDVTGKLLGSAPLDLTDFCLDPAHVGKKDHVRGDVIVQHHVVITVKVPAFAATTEVRIVKVSAGRTTVLGKIDRKTIAAMTAKKKEVR